MPKRKSSTAVSMRGKGFFDVLGKVHDFVKDNKLISKGLSMIPNPYAKGGSVVTGLLGYGKRRKKMTRTMMTMKGRGKMPKAVLLM